MRTQTDNRIQQAFDRQAHPLFIPYVTAGDPHPDVTVDLLLTLEEAGADIIELGVPYSDPLADGPVIQRASNRALQHGVTLSKVLEMGREARLRGVSVPLVLFTYVNPVFRMGIEVLCRRAKAAGFDGMIVPDLPMEENGELLEAAKRHHLAFIPLVAPTSDERIERIVAGARGFVYCVSSLGTTGTRDTFSDDVIPFLRRVRALSAVPTAVGFGVSKREHVEAFAPHVDAVVVGSALVREIQAVRDKLLHPNRERRQAGHAHIRGFVRMLKNG